LFNIKNVVLEGPDLAGKSTLYANVHQMTGFSWNVQDRSHLSMLCYARQYGRGEEVVERWRSDLKEYLLHLNNRLIVLLPSLDSILERLTQRGDERQSRESLSALHSIFSEEVQALEGMPNVLILRPTLPALEMAELCVQWLIRAQSNDIHAIAQEVQQLTNMSPETREVVGCRLQLTPLPNDALMENSDVMRYPPEEEYYASTLKSVLSNIDDEMLGRNEYGKVQPPETTRRFIHTQGTCISLFHTMLRGDTLTLRVYCRSSNVRDTFLHDLKFIYYLCGRVRQRLCRTRVDIVDLASKIRIDIEVGSAHIPQES